MRRLSGMDAAFLYLETPTTHMQVQAVMLLDPSTVPGGYSFEKIKAHLASRLPRLPEFRRRLAHVPFDLHRIFTEEGYDFIDDIIWVKPEGAGWATGRCPPSRSR